MCAALRIGGLILLFLVCAPIHVVTKLLSGGRSPWPQWFLASAAWIVGARVRTTGGPATAHTLLVANHTSWLDILVLGGATNCAFVSKAELGHSLIHWLADQDETVYVQRAQRSGAKDQAVAIAKALERHKPVVLFPEGTTGPGTHLLPFRSTLLEAVNYAAKDVLVRPVAVDYGPAAPEVGWFDEAGKDNVLRLLGRKGTVPVTIRILPPLDRSGDRKQLAADASAAIADTLGFKSGPHSPIAASQ